MYVLCIMHARMTLHVLMMSVDLNHHLFYRIVPLTSPGVSGTLPVALKIQTEQFWAAHLRCMGSPQIQRCRIHVKFRSDLKKHVHICIYIYIYIYIYLNAGRDAIKLALPGFRHRVDWWDLPARLEWGLAPD